MYYSVSNELNNMPHAELPSCAGAFGWWKPIVRGFPWFWHAVPRCAAFELDLLPSLVSERYNDDKIHWASTVTEMKGELQVICSRLGLSPCETAANLWAMRIVDRVSERPDWKQNLAVARIAVRFLHSFSVNTHDTRHACMENYPTKNLNSFGCARLRLVIGFQGVQIFVGKHILCRSRR